jgi:N-acetylmuramoyl-L-alanine amidase
MKKSVYTLLAVLFFLCLFPRLSHAEEAIPLFFNGKALVSKVPAQNIKGTTMVPIRIISETLGAVVGWNDKEKKVSVTKENLKIEMKLAKKEVMVNGKWMQLTEPPLNVKGTALLPLRFLAENLGLKVAWNDKARSVSLSKLAIEKPAVVVEKPVVAVEKPVVVVEKPADSNGTSAIHIHGDGSEGAAVTVDPGTVPVAVTPITLVPVTVIQTIQSVNDQVIVQANGDLHPSLFYLSSPDRLVVDFKQSTLIEGLRSSNNPSIDLTIPTADVNFSTTESGFSVTSSVYMDKVRYANFTDKPPTVRVVIDLKQKTSYQLIEDKVNHQVIITQKVVPYTIVIDGGHGGKDTGAISINNRLEKDFNLSMVLKIQQLLAKEPLIQVVLTRQDDTFVELNDRAAIANNLNATLFVSIHGNSYAKTSNGSETYYYKDDSLAFAQTMHPHILGATGFADKKVRNSKFRVVTATEMPAILCEIGYLSNPTEEAAMFNEEFQNRVAAAIVAGIKEYLNIN